MLSVELERLVLRYFEDLGTPFSLKCAILWRYGEREALASLTARPEDYVTPEDYFRAACACAFVKKLNGSFGSDEARRDAAVKKWFEGEDACYQTNLRLYPYLPSGLERDERISSVFDEIRKIVVELIGYGPPGLATGRFGPGATFSDRGSRVTVPHKINANPTLTRDAIWHLPQFFGTAWGSFVAHERELVFVRGNRFATVPKTSKTDRSIAVEPSINVFFQLAAGGALRSALKRSHGWDLDYAQDVHRAKAREASLTSEFATLDLSNASDTVAYNLVKLLLPHRWFDLLNDLRSPRTSHPIHHEKWKLLEKFSSMGNGYTFELETVIFASLAIFIARSNGHFGVLGKDVFVFGDDIILPDDCVRGITALLAFCGFSLNKEKSFSGRSPFRESCGADFFNGIDVRPSYIKEDPNEPRGWISIANRIYQSIQRAAAMAAPISDSAWRLALGNVPLRFRLYGPSGLGDSVIWTDPSSELKWRVRWKHSIRTIRGLKFVPRRLVRFADFDPRVVLACAVYGTGNVGTPVGGLVPAHEGVVPRASPVSYVIGWLPFS